MPSIQDIMDFTYPRKPPPSRPVPRDLVPEGMSVKVQSPPLYGTQPPPPANDLERMIRHRDRLITERKPPENPFYVKDELLPGRPGNLKVGGGIDSLDYKGAADDRSADALWKDSGVLNSYYNNLSKKGMSEDEIAEVLKSLAEDQKKARAQLYAKPVEITVEDN